jgi:hypothetical protein
VDEFTELARRIERACETDDISYGLSLILLDMLELIKTRATLYSNPSEEVAP